MAFLNTKTNRLNATDFSRKGEIDEGIVELIQLVNSNDSYFTTSSCSGRIILFCEIQDTKDTASHKRGCQWLYVTHGTASSEELDSALQGSAGNAVLKFEPFVLHVQCRSIEDARILHQLAVSAGFRNSGITVGNGGKIMTAVRSTHGLEVPLMHNGTVLVSKEYISYLVELANTKMSENNLRIERFHEALRRKLTEIGNQPSTSLSDKKRRKDSGRVMRTCHMKHSATQTDDNEGNKVNCPTVSSADCRTQATPGSGEDMESHRNRKTFRQSQEDGENAGDDLWNLSGGLGTLDLFDDVT